MGEFGDFEEVKEDSGKKVEQPQEQRFPSRVKLPRAGQFIGIIVQRLGGKRMLVKTTDGKTRNCRVPGRFRRRFWLREGNYIVIEPWPDDDGKGDVVYQYRPNEIIQLKKKRLLENLRDEF